MTLKTTILKTRESLLDLVFPPRCVGCGAQGAFLCDSCIAVLPVLPEPFCERCGVPVAGGKLCSRCFASAMVISGIRSVFLHEGLAREAVHQLKYHHLRVLSKPLAGLLSDYLETNPISFDVIVPVPSHSRRVRSRGYNQAALLALELSHICQSPVADGGLVRLSNTSSQVSLGISDRLSNVEGVFRCKTTAFEKRRVLLVDDVCTTGATLNACAAALKCGGALSVWGLTVSRECLESAGG